MPEQWLVDLQSALERDDDELATVLVVLASVAGRDVPLDEEDAAAATRRAMLLLTAGGDPARGLDLNGRAVVSLADELDEPERRTALARGLAELRAQALGLAELTEALRALEAEPDIAWRAYACSLLAESLDD